MDYFFLTIILKLYCQFNEKHNLSEMLEIFELKIPCTHYVLGERTRISMKNELYQTNVKSKGLIYRTS